MTNLMVATLGTHQGEEGIIKTYPANLIYGKTRVKKMKSMFVHGNYSIESTKGVKERRRYSLNIHVV